MEITVKHIPYYMEHQVSMRGKSLKMRAIGILGEQKISKAIWYIVYEI